MHLDLGQLTDQEVLFRIRRIGYDVVLRALGGEGEYGVAQRQLQEALSHDLIQGEEVKLSQQLFRRYAKGTPAGRLLQQLTYGSQVMQGARESAEGFDADLPPGLVLEEVEDAMWEPLSIPSSGGQPAGSELYPLKPIAMVGNLHGRRAQVEKTDASIIDEIFKVLYRLETGN